MGAPLPADVLRTIARDLSYPTLRAFCATGRLATRICSAAPESAPLWRALLRRDFGQRAGPAPYEEYRAAWADLWGGGHVLEFSGGFFETFSYTYGDEISRVEHPLFGPQRLNAPFRPRLDSVTLALDGPFDYRHYLEIEAANGVEITYDDIADGIVDLLSDPAPAAYLAQIARDAPDLIERARENDDLGDDAPITVFSLAREEMWEAYGPLGGATHGDLVGVAALRFINEQGAPVLLAVVDLFDLEPDGGD